MYNFIAILSVHGLVKQAQQFYNKFKDQINPDLQKAVELVCESTIFCGRRDQPSFKQYQSMYFKLYQFSQQKGFIDERHRLIAKNNRIRICYDWHINAEEDIKKPDGKILNIRTDEIRLFKRFLKKIPQQERAISNLVFTDFISKMLSFSAEKNASTVKNSLLQKLEAAPLVSCREWLERRIKTL